MIEAHKWKDHDQHHCAKCGKPANHHDSLTHRYRRTTEEHDWLEHVSAGHQLGWLGWALIVVIVVLLLVNVVRLYTGLW